ncbi:osteopetrosis-associated transmembrane protein 1 [Python bivittatus]|uniref:Osteopetrosis-associated transmembrane protein 1 n=1 Tax=Python bivittatus TaxID=176946 RepID=A0A9F2KUD4_PYTBI|nr:osteopetrosis-associated transmembrane protein 1 [Python bivittatus]
MGSATLVVVVVVLLLLPGVLVGLCAGERLLPGRHLLLQSGLEEMVLGGRHRAWPLELLELEDLSSSESGFLGLLLEPQLDPECKELLSAFANSSMRFTGCLIRSARPVTLCQNCYHQFQEVMQQLKNIENTTKSNHCVKSLLMSDRLQMVALLSKFFNETWIKANCANCLKDNNEGLSAGTVTFLALYNESMACFKQNLQEGNQLPSNYSGVCKNCNATYKNLSSHFSEMQRQGQHEESGEQFHLCIDVEDAMNITQRLWSTTFNCSVPCTDTVPVIAVSLFIFFLPLVFYLSTFLHSKQKKRVLILGKRIHSNASFANIQDKSS